jgi:hypothetical protein
MHLPRLCTVVLLVATVACARQGEPAPTGSPDDVTLTSAIDGVITDFPEEGAKAFIATYPELDSIRAGDGLLLFPKGSAERIATTRSKLPKNHPLYADDDLAQFDRVLIRTRLSSTDSRAYFVLFTDGGSGDPAFYVIAEGDSVSSNEVWGEILALPASGQFAVYQRTNSDFAKRNPVRLDRGALLAVPMPSYHVGLRSITTDTLPLTRTRSDSTIVARIPKGAVVEVLATNDSTTTRGTAFLVRTSAGLRGWAHLQVLQCPAAVIRGICFMGD